MGKLLAEIKHDANFIKDHTLQPQWWKIAKVFLMLGIFIGYGLLFGWLKALIFAVVFMLIMFGVHMMYRINTKKMTTSWLDFQVYEEDGQLKYKRIGIYYYLIITLSVILAVLLSQWLG